MTKNMKLNPHERNIHIAAVSDIYTVYEIVPERKAVARLEQIRKLFLSMKEHHLRTANDVKDAAESIRRKNKINSDKLVVKTGIHNPEFHFN